MRAEQVPAAPLLSPPLTVWGDPAERTRTLSVETVCSRVFWGWLAVRTLLWTLVATLTQPNAPLDVIEWLYWGHEWCWGYHKHPPLPAWLIESCALLSPGSLWAVYLASYLAVGACMAAVWRLGREMVSPKLALLAALSLEGVTFYTFAAAEFNNNVVLNAVSALAILAFFFALRTDSLRWWLATGLFLGMALLAKYTAAFLILPMLAFLLWQPEARRSLRRPGPYLTAAVALLLFAPHVVWMVQNDFPTLHYAQARSVGSGQWYDRLAYPLEFCGTQFIRLLPLLIIVLPLTCYRWRSWPATERFNRDFLLMMVLGPVAVHLLVSLTAGLHLRAIWGAQLWTYTGLLLVVCLKTRPPERTFVRGVVRLGVVATLLLASTLLKNHYGPLASGSPSRIHFPGKALAREINQQWHQEHEQPYPLVGGDWWLAGNVACYAAHRPSVYPSRELWLCEPEPRAASWTSDEDFQQRGGVLLWNAQGQGDDLPERLRQRFPAAEVKPPLLLPYECSAPLPPLRVGVAFVTPHSLTSRERGITRSPGIERDEGKD